jgi:hypothetical protein
VSTILIVLGELLRALLRFSIGSLSIAGGVVLLVLAVWMVLAPPSGGDHFAAPSRPKLGAFLVFARRLARPSHTLPFERVLRFRHGSAGTTLRSDASNAGRSVSSFK